MVFQMIERVGIQFVHQKIKIWLLKILMQEETVKVVLGTYKYSTNRLLVREQFFWDKTLSSHSVPQIPSTTVEAKINLTV